MVKILIVDAFESCCAGDWAALAPELTVSGIGQQHAQRFSKRQREVYPNLCDWLLISLDTFPVEAVSRAFSLVGFKMC